MRNIILGAQMTQYAEPIIDPLKPFELFDIKANASKTIEFRYEAKAHASAAQVITKVAIMGWSVDLDGPYSDGTVLPIAHAIEG